jgi:pimeloyl-ACP methyl ester carboxylesterase
MNEPRTIYLFVNGIATWPGNFTNWNKRAVTFTHTQTENYAEAFEYFCTPLTRPFREDQRARHFARAVKEYARLGWKIICVGHSNGCAVILDGLERAGWPRVESIHLVCGACESDFWLNGLNVALDRDRLGSVFVYMAEQDWALPLAHTIPGKLLGYGTLGLRGAERVYARVAGRVHQLYWPSYGHSTCWLPNHFKSTMEIFFRAQAALENPHYGGKHLLSRHD